MTNTTIFQGAFVSNGQSLFIPLVAGVTWMNVYNLTVMSAAQVNAAGAQYYWQKGFGAGSGIEYKKSNAANAANLIQYLGVNGGGFTYIDSTINVAGILNIGSVTAVSGAATPVVTENVVPNNLNPGNVVRLTNVAGAVQLNGLDFSVGYGTLTNATFSLDYMPQIVATAAINGNWQQIQVTSSFYPRRRYITKIVAGVQGGTCVITTSVDHGYTVGQEIRVSVPSDYGMTMPPTIGTIIAVDTATGVGHNTMTVNIDISQLAPFVFPLTNAGAFTPALVVPVGENTSTALFYNEDILDDSTYDTNAVGLLLAAGADGPAGQNGDSICWTAGTCFSNNLYGVIQP